MDKMLAEKTLERIRRYSTQHYTTTPLVLSSADPKGVRVWGPDDVVYDDFASGYSSVNGGHCDPRLLTTFMNVGLGVVPNIYTNPWLGELVEKLCRLLDYDKALITNTGAEAYEAGVKIARKWGYTRKGVEGAFHGRTLGALATSSENWYRDDFSPHVPGFVRIPHDDVSALESAITDNTVMFITEAIQGEGGVRVPSPEYLSACMSLCKKHNVLLAVDEIQTGLCRTGKLLASHNYGVHPDLVLLGKSLGGGLIPVSAVVGNKVIDVLEPGQHGGTYAGNAHACAVACKALDIMVEEDFCGRAQELGSYLVGKLQRLKSSLIHDVRGKGLLIGIEHTKDILPSDMLQRFLDKRILTTGLYALLHLL
jgi:ornithine--oxo-acid transaminase